MFGSNARELYRRGKDAAATLARRDVTSEEFVAAMLAAGHSQKDADLHVKVTRGLGGHAWIGNAMLRVVDPK